MASDFHKTVTDSTSTAVSYEDLELENRKRTFAGWTYVNSILLLAQAGFKYTGVADKVECVSCGIRLYNWQENEDILLAHKRYSPDCAFMITHHPHVIAPPQPLPVFTVKYPEFADYYERLKTYTEAGWPLRCVAQTPDMMARSGFYYTGSTDRARCFHCGVTLRDWDTDDYPPSAHTQWSPNCPFVKTLDIGAMRKEIEQNEREERLRTEFQNTVFLDCSSNRNIKKLLEFPQNDVEVDGCVETTDSLQVHSQISESADMILPNTPAVQAVIEMGYSQDVIKTALAVRIRQGMTEPSASALMETIFELE